MRSNTSESRNHIDEGKNIDLRRTLAQGRGSLPAIEIGSRALQTKNALSAPLRLVVTLQGL
jgi:hypothetical protein